MVIKPKILSTSFMPREFVEKAAIEGITFDIIPFTEVKSNNDQILRDNITTIKDQHITAVFTSANAVIPLKELGLDNMKGWDVYCMGNKTRSTIEELFENVEISGTAVNAAGLAQVIIKNHPAEVFFFCGDIRLDTLPGALNEAGINVKEIVMYQTTGIHHSLPGKYDCILFFSPSAVRSFFKNNTLSSYTTIFTLGNTTAEAVKTYTDNKIFISPVASREAVAIEAINYCKSLK